MAVTTTPQDLLEAAYAKSMKNNPGQIVSEATEALNLVIRTMRKFYSIAARVNPLYFAGSSVVAAPGAALPWARPEGAESVFYITGAAGVEVVGVPLEDKTAESQLPGVYFLGKNYYAAGNANDPNPASDALTFWYSRRPTDPSSITGVVDSQWEEASDGLIVTEIAAYLANKDGREEELAFLVKERDEWLRPFIMMLEHANINVRYRFANVRRFNAPTAVPLTDLLVGGTTVKLSRGGD